MEERKPILWNAYCVDCHKNLETGDFPAGAWEPARGCANGDWTEAWGKYHERQTGHKVIIGYMIEPSPETIQRSKPYPLQETDHLETMANSADPTEGRTIWNSDGSKPCLITTPPKTLSNDFCSLEFEAPNKQIHGTDKTDQNNLPAFYTKSKRGIANAWAYIVRNFDKTTRMHDVLNMLQGNHIKTHYWCMMD